VRPVPGKRIVIPLTSRIQEIIKMIALITIWAFVLTFSFWFPALSMFGERATFGPVVSLLSFFFISLKLRRMNYNLLIGAIDFYYLLLICFMIVIATLSSANSGNVVATLRVSTTFLVGLSLVSFVVVYSNDSKIIRRFFFFFLLFVYCRIISISWIFISYNWEIYDFV